MSCSPFLMMRLELGLMFGNYQPRFGGAFSGLSAARTARQSGTKASRPQG